MTTSSGRAGRLPIDAEQLSAYERYELPLVGESEAVGGRDGPPRALTASQLEALQRQAYDEAYREGHAAGLVEGAAAGREQGLADVSPVASALRAGVAQLARPFDALDEEVERDLVRLALTVARQIVLHEIGVSSETVLQCVREAVRALPSAERKVTIELNPEDLGYVREALDAPAAAVWELREDPEIARGGCRVHTESSHVDATLETRLERIVVNVLGGSHDDAEQP